MLAKLPRIGAIVFGLWAVAPLVGCETASSACPPNTVLSAAGCVPVGAQSPCGPGTTFNGQQCIPDPDAVPAADAVVADTLEGTDASSGTDGASQSDLETATDVAATTDATAGSDADQIPDIVGDPDAIAPTDAVSDPDASGVTDAVAQSDAVATTDTAQSDSTTPEDSSQGTDALVLDIPVVVPCVAVCDGKQCGPDGCGGLCGTCQFVAGKPFCSATGQCVSNACVPDCTDSECGDDGCGGTCGGCPAGKGCTLNYCVTLEVGFSCEGHCGGFAPAGCSCEPGCEGVTCCPDVTAACGCKPQCTDKDCGPDGCGGQCGTCDTGTLCSNTGTCDDDPCLPDPCNGHGSCSAGVCSCNLGYSGSACDSCINTYVGYPDCAPNPCNNQGCGGVGQCDPVTGGCTCPQGFVGETCGACAFDNHVWPDCKATACEGVDCGLYGECNPADGKCLCDPNFIGGQCNTCADLTKSFPDCADMTFAGDPALAGLSCFFCAEPLPSFVTPSDAFDDLPASLKVAIPPANSMVGPGTPIILLIDDHVDAASVTTETFGVALYDEVSQTYTVMEGSIVAQATSTGQTLLIFFPVNMTQSGVYVVGMEGVTDTNGNLVTPFSYTFAMDAELAASGFGDNLSFEEGATGCITLGDAHALEGSGDMQPSDGFWQMVLSTGQPAEWSLSPETTALAEQSSLVICGPVPIPAGATQVQFDANFGSTEYDQFVGQSFDDLVIAAVAGPNGGAGGVLTSVNNAAEIAIKGSAYGLPNAGDSDAVFRHTGTNTVTIGGIGAVGEWMTLVFVVTDVADTAYPSILTIDNIRFGFAEF